MLNQRLRQERERLGLSQDEFARRLGISRVTQNYYENGSREPGLTYLSAFGQAGGNLLFLLFADEAPHEYADLLDWGLLERVWDWVGRVAVDSKGVPYPPEIQKKIFLLAYRACRSIQNGDPEAIDLTMLLGQAA